MNTEIKRQIEGLIQEDLDLDKKYYKTHDDAERKKITHRQSVVNDVLSDLKDIVGMPDCIVKSFFWRIAMRKYDEEKHRILIAFKNGDYFDSNDISIINFYGALSGPSGLVIGDNISKQFIPIDNVLGIYEGKDAHFFLPVNNRTKWDKDHENDPKAITYSSTNQNYND